MFHINACHMYVTRMSHDHISAGFCGVYISQIKSLGVIHGYIFTNGPVPTIYWINWPCIYLTKYSQLNVGEYRRNS